MRLAESGETLRSGQAGKSSKGLGQRVSILGGKLAVATVVPKGNGGFGLFDVDAAVVGNSYLSRTQASVHFVRRPDSNVDLRDRCRPRKLFRERSGRFSLVCCAKRVAIDTTWVNAHGHLGFR
jgi:hypothetical protein